MLKTGYRLAIMTALFSFIASGGHAAEKLVLCTTFPIYQITRNVAHGRDGIRVDLLLPAMLGCPHHYALTTRDMRKLASAAVLVINGLGMEEFLGEPLQRANPSIRVISSSEGIEDLIWYAHNDDCRQATAHGCDHDLICRAGVNPHLFASPRMSARLAANIAGALSVEDPEGADLYIANAAAYAGRMQALTDEMTELAGSLGNNRIVQPHGILDYLARDIGLKIVAVTQPHGREPSAAEMLDIVRTVREKRAGAIFTEPQYSSRVGRTIAKETGIPAAVLDPAASGPEAAPLDYFDKVMRKNMETLRATLGAGH